MRASASALFGHIHDRNKLRGPVAKHGVAPKSEDVDFRPIRLDMLPKVTGASARTGIVSHCLLDCVPVALRHYVEQGQLQERLSVITVMNDRRVVHGHEFQGFGIEEPHRNRIVLEDQFERFFRLISLGHVPVCPDPADRLAMLIQNQFGFVMNPSHRAPRLDDAKPEVDARL